MAGGGESQRHWQLKQAALVWLAEQQYPVRATEIRLPNGNYRADVVAYRPELAAPAEGKGRRQHQVGTTAILECKQARSDFLKDTRSLLPPSGTVGGRMAGTSIFASFSD